MSQTLSHQRRDAWPINRTSKDAHASGFFSILPALHTQDAFAFILNFEVGHFTHHLLLSFFLLVLLWKEFNPHGIIVTFHFSCSSSSLLVFYPARDGCWIHVNIGCSAHIYSTSLIVSSNNKPWLAHQKQQSVGSAFQFHYIPTPRDLMIT